MAISPSFIVAAKRADRRPVVMLAIEDINAIKRTVSTPSEWKGYKSSSNLNFDTEPGAAFLSTNGIEPIAGDYAGAAASAYVATAAVPEIPYPPVYGVPIPCNYESAAVLISGTRTVAAALTFRAITSGYSFLSLPMGGTSCMLVGLNLNAEVWGSRTGGTGWEYIDTVPVYHDGSTFQYDPVLNPNTGVEDRYYHHKVVTHGVTFPQAGEWTVKIKFLAAIPTHEDRFVPASEFLPPTSGQYRLEGYTPTHATRYLASGTTQTRTVDMDVIPTIPSRVEIDDTVPTGCTATYAMRGSNASPTGPWIDLGTVTDGQSIAAYRYYDWTATLTSSLDGLRTPTVTELRVVGGDAQYRYYSTHKDIPVQGAKPYILEDGINSLSSKVELMGFSTTGELSVKLHWTREVSDLVATGYLKNKAIICKIGFVGLAETDFETYFVGTIHDWQGDHEKRVITLKTRDVWKQFKTKVPEENYFLDAAGNVIEGKTYALSGNIIDTIISVVDLAGVPDRYINRAGLEALKAAHYTGLEWLVSRELTEAVNADDLLKELAVSAGLLLTVGTDGRLTALHYDTVVAGAPAVTLDAQKIQFKAVEGGQKELFTRQAVYYQLQPGKSGGSKEDYAKGYVFVDAAAEVAWGESHTKEWMDKWGLTATVIERLAQRMGSWYANPKATTKADNIPPRYVVPPGSLITVDWLRLPAPAANWPGFSAGKKFLVTSRSFDPKTYTWSLDLWEVGTTNYQTGKLPTYSSWGVYPPVLNLQAIPQAVIKPGGGGELVIDVTFDTPAAATFGGAEVWYKAGAGAWQFYRRIEYGGPNEHRTVTIPAAAATAYTVAVVTVNAANQRADIALSPQASVTVPVLTPPAPVTGISQQVIDNNVLLRWAAAVIGSYPVAEYVILKGTDYATAVEIGRRTGTFLTIFEASAGTYKYWVVPVDTAGQPGDPVGIYATVSQPPDYVLKDQQALNLAAGALVNCVVDIDGGLACLVNTTETFQGHFDSRSWAGPQDQVNAGYSAFAQPGEASASAEWVVDYGATIPGTRITMDVTRDLVGSVTITPRISVSNASATGPWTDFTGAYQAYTTNFRWVKYRLDFASATGGLAHVHMIDVKLDTKQKTVEGTITCNAGDSGGTIVDITGKFIDVMGITVTPKGTTPIIAVYDFVDTSNPTQFKILLFTTAGARVTADAGYIVRGV